MGYGQRHVGVLLYEQHRCALLVDLHDDVTHLLDQERGQPERRLVENQQLGALHQGTADRQHLLFATRQVAGRRRSSLRQTGKQSHHSLVRLVEPGTVEIGTGPEVLGHSHLGEDSPPFHDLTDALRNDVGRVLVGDIFTVEVHRALGDVAFVHVVQPGDRPHRRGLARTIGTEQGNDLAVGNLEGDPAQNQDHVVVDEFEVLDGKHLQV